MSGVHKKDILISSISMLKVYTANKLQNITFQYSFKRITELENHFTKATWIEVLFSKAFDCSLPQLV